MPRHALTLLSSLALLGTPTAWAQSGIEGLPPGHPQIHTGDTTIYEVMAGDIAKHRGASDAAWQFYMDAAVRLASGTIAGLAWEAAASAQDTNRMLEAARLWLELEPTSLPAFHTLFISALEQNRTDEAKRILDRTVPILEANTEKKASGNWLLMTAKLARTLPANQAKSALNLLIPHANQYPNRIELTLAIAQLERAAGERTAACRRVSGVADALKQNASDANIIEAADLCWSIDRQATFTMLEKHLQAHPKAADVRMVYARALQRAGDDVGALREAAHALKSAEAPSLYFNAAQLASNAGDVEKSEKWLTEYVRRIREEDPDADLSHEEFWIQYGNAAFLRKDYALAVERYRELTNGPLAAQARLREAVALTDSGRLEEGLRILRNARTSANVDAPFLFSAESALLLENGRALEALAVMTQAVQLFPSDTETLYEAAMVAQENLETKQSEAWLEALLAIDPNHVQGNNALGYLWTEQNRRLPEARKLLEKAYRADPLNPYILDSMGWLCYREGRLRAAREFTAASLKKLYDAEVAGHLVQILVALGERSEAHEVLDELIRREGRTPKAESLLKLLGEMK